MKTCDFIFVGVAKNKACKELEQEYLGRIKRYSDTRIMVVKDSSHEHLAHRQNQESEDVLSKTGPGDKVILCDEHGIALTSEGLSKKIVDWRVATQRVVFVIGGAYGVSATLKKKASFTLKLSDFTLPHELARVVLLEQVYRAFTIVAGEKYHH